MFNKIEELIEDIRQGKMVILVDDEDRENEGDIVLAADHVTPQAINFMASEARGLICLSLSAAQIERLKLPLMVRDDQNFSSNKTAFTVSIEASTGVTTGISAADRTRTIQVASNPEAKATDIHMPGHIFPIRAQEGGVLRRAGHTEGSVDLAILAGCGPSAVICEVMNPDGTMARVPDLKAFAKKHNMKIGTIVDLIEYRLARDVLVEEVLAVDLPPAFGAFKARVFRSKVDGLEHLVLQKGEIKHDEPVTVRVHLDSYTRDLFALMRQGQSQVEAALNRLKKEDAAVLLLLRGNNRGSLVAEIKALTGEAEPHPMDQRDYGIGAQILRQLGAHQIRLVTNKLDKKVGLKAYNLEIVDVISISDEDLELDTEKDAEKEVKKSEGFDGKENSKESKTGSEKENDHKNDQSGRRHFPIQ